MIIAVDGPAGAGKGTISRALAQHFSLKYIDTGLMYRALAYKALAENVDLSHENSLVTLAKTLTTGDLQLPELRMEEVGNAASKIAVLPAVRAQITLHTRRFSQEITAPYKGVVLDGRDIGTVVCPDADIKIFVTAAPKVRAERRLAEMMQSGKQPQQNMLEQIIERDQRDQTRAASPLVPAIDATLLDTSELTIRDAC
ncbi:MAG: (d)CMP kinase, partial [Pseudomonadota bacterium]|nr:(d)CMP kinase [Pseudomonadota bacterium]